LRDRFGNPEHVFGPNLRFRIVAGGIGIVLVVLGIIYFLMAMAGVPLGAWVSAKLTVPMMALGVILLIGTRLVPVHWVFVCPRGLLRRRGDIWDHVGWSEVERFEDATLGQKGVTIRQCRIITTAGAEWGFLADHIADYGRLAELLRHKVDECRKPASAPDPGHDPVS
jgi:hypothetical protein